MKFANMMELSKEVMDICVKTWRNSMTEDEAFKQMKKIVATSTAKSSPSFMFDILEMVDVAVGSLPTDSDGRRRMTGLLKNCMDGLIPDDVVKVNVDSIGDDASMINQRFVKMKTKLFFKQLKFNLLREESEGYAKLITELCQYDDGVSPLETLNRVRCLIGQFNLDPNRSLDILLECFEAALDVLPSSADVNRSPVVTFYVDLLRAYNPNKDDLCHIVGFKFTFYAAKRAAAVAISAPTSLYTMAALLISHGMVEIAELCSYLAPKVDAIVAEHKEAMDAANARCKQLSVSALGPEWDPTESNADETTALGEQASFSNQKLGLTQALLTLNAWNEARFMLDRLPEFYAVRNATLASSLCRMIDSMISGIYKKHCPQYCIALDEADLKTDTNSASSLSAFVREVLPIVAYLGPHLSMDPILMTKLIRLCAAAYSKVASQHESEPIDPVPIIDTCQDVLLPSLGRLRSNCPVAEELWALLSQFPYTTRFRMYGRLKAEHEKRHPMLIIAKGETVGKARYIMKRVSKETIKTAGRQLGKLSHSCAMSVFDYILNQIQQFENLIGPVVDSMKFLSNLSYDALAYCIIEHLSSPEKEKLKVSDANLSPWLQSLATFIGSVCKKYNVELTGILQYVANQLKSGKSFDLLVLREIIENMSGVETSSGLTRDQLEALTGGDTLRTEAGNFGQVRNTKRSANRLKDALMQEDLVVSLCILMGQQRGCIVFNEGAKLHLKLAGQMLDQCQETLVQFGNFLATSLKSEDYVKRMPPAPELMSSYHLSPETAMFLSRPAYAYKILAKYEELKKADRASKTNLTPERKLQHYKTACGDILDPLSKELAIVFPTNTWMDMTPSLFCTFWTLTMYDLSVPTAAYEREIDRLKKLAQSEDSRDVSDAKKRKEKERFQQLENKLADEQRRQQEHVERVMAQLNDDRLEWFPAKSARMVSVAHFLQLCALPRVYYSDVDALYAAKFIHTLHRIKTPCFSTLICYDRIFCDIAPIVFSLSENEANHFGRFLCAALEAVMHWHKDQETFDKECKGYPGFITRFRNASADDPAKDVVDFETFRHVVHKWHFKLTKTFLMALQSGSYVAVRNALLVLIKILPQYPAVVSFSQAIEKRVVVIRDEEKEKRQDLHVLAASYWGHLKVRKAPTLVEADFHNVQQKDKEIARASSGQLAVKGRVATVASVSASPNSARTPERTESLPASGDKQPADVNSPEKAKQQPVQKSSTSPATSAPKAAASGQPRNSQQPATDMEPKSKRPRTEKRIEEPARANGGQLAVKGRVATVAATATSSVAAKTPDRTDSSTPSGDKQPADVASPEKVKSQPIQKPSTAPASPAPKAATSGGSSQPRNSQQPAADTESKSKRTRADGRIDENKSKPAAADIEPKSKRARTDGRSNENKSKADDAKHSGNSSSQAPTKARDERRSPSSRWRKRKD